MASSSSSSKSNWDVFLSFRGVDTRNNFTAHLYEALNGAGVRTFRDSEGLRKGEDISADLMGAIQGSRISVIVFSKYYAHSRWCLDELLLIMECRDTLPQMVFPIFYHVDPSHVRRQTGTFAAAFQNHKARHEDARHDVDTHTISRWRSALQKAANLSGWHFNTDQSEAGLITEIVDQISRRLNNTYLHVAIHPVGIDSRLRDISNSLGVGQDDDVRMVGIWGMGGSGKTSLAKAIYNKFYHDFEEIDISILLQRCLVIVNEKNKLIMHDLLRDMGREVVRAESYEDPEERSRLWCREEVIDVLTEESGTKKIEGLALNMQRSDKQSFRTKAFKKMQKLKLLQLNYAKLTGDYDHLSKKLSWLCWRGFPLEFMGNDFLHQGNLVSLDLRYSNLVRVWEHPRLLEKLKILNLSHSPYLTQSPDLSKLPNLECFIMKDCNSLSEIHPSIGDVKRLALVNLKDCKMLKDLPRSFYKLKFIETLVLSGCSRFENLVEEIGDMTSLTTLVVRDTAVSQVPSYIGRLKNLNFSSVQGLVRLKQRFPEVPKNYFPAQD